MNASIKKIICVLMALVLLCCALPGAAFAEGEVGGTDGSTADTEPTAPPATVKLEQLRVKGSNNKVYLCSPNLSDSVNAYSFNVPDWMESATISFTGSSGIAATCSNGQSVISDGSAYSVSVELSEKKHIFTLALKKDGLTRELQVTINRRQIDCYIEDIMLYNGDNKVQGEGNPDTGVITFNLPSGTTTGLRLRVKPRHENTVAIANITDKEDGEAITENEKVSLKLQANSTYYPCKLDNPENFAVLEEGTNIYHVEVKAGSITRTCTVKVIVGDPNANSPTTTTTTTTTTAPLVDPSANVSTTMSTFPSGQQTLPGNSSGGSMDSIPKVLWILIAIIAMVVIGSCIFMIVNMNGANRRNSGYGNYDYDYGPPPRRRRNLTEYMDDEYYDDYGYGRGGRYDDYDDYDDYDQPPRRGGRYDDYDDYDQPPRRRYDDYDNYDGFEGGGYDDGYGGGGY